MKFLCALLSIYVMLISSVACKDGYVLEKSKTQIVLLPDTDHAETPSDLCSSFCTCTCCAGFSQSAIAQINPIVTVILDMTHPYLEKRNSSDTYPPFQPPKA